MEFPQANLQKIAQSEKKQNKKLLNFLKMYIHIKKKRPFKLRQEYSISSKSRTSRCQKSRAKNAQ